MFVPSSCIACVISDHRDIGECIRIILRRFSYDSTIPFGVVVRVIYPDTTLSNAVSSESITSSSVGKVIDFV